MTANGNGYGINGQGTWGSAICTVGSNTTIQKCISYENKGEGLNAYSSSSNVIMQDNIAYDNKAYNLYLDSSNGGIIRRNIIYQTKPSYYQYGITIGAETGQASDLSIYNNLVLGCMTNFHIDSNISTLSNIHVCYNTFVNSVGGYTGYNMGVYYRPDISSYSNSTFRNNIVLEEDSGRVPIYVESSHPGLTFSDNCWNKTPVAAALGTGDVFGNPLLAKTGPTGAGLLTPAYFKILANSPARNMASVQGNITEDFFKTPRGSDPDMGAHEFSYGTSALTASASGSPMSGLAPLAVNFTGSASGGTSPYSYRWSFGDSSSSTTQNPSHTYSSSGSYTATLTVTDSTSATDTATVNINVTTSVPLSANIAASPTSGQAPLTVNFTGSASGGASPYG
jgi:PKD repeat protein